MHHDSFPRWLIIILALVFVILLVAGTWFYNSQRHQLRRKLGDELQAIAQLKAGQIAAWRSERLSDGHLISENAIFTQAAIDWMADPQSNPPQNILSWFQTLQKQYLYHNILLVDVNGQIRLHLNEENHPLSTDATAALLTAWRDRQPVMTDLHYIPGHTRIHIDVIAPLFESAAPDAEPIGAVLLQSDATQFLFPLLQSWPTPSESAETILIRRDGEDVLFLNDLRHQADTALKLRVPLSETDVPAVQAVLGTTEIVHGRDYRGVKVLSALNPIPDSPWLLVSKVDESEIYEEWRFRSSVILILILGLLAIVGAAAGGFWLRMQKNHYQSLFEAEKARQQSEARYRTVLMSIGDGTVTTDLEGRVQLLNPVAARLTGWSPEEAKGKPLEEVFHIVDERTRETVENPVRQVARDGQIVGLANHTLLISKEGREIPIADSAAPILDAQGNLTGTVLVFRDQLEERTAQKALVASEARYKSLFENNHAPMLIIDPAAHVVIDANLAACAFYGWTRQEFPGKLLRDISTLPPEGIVGAIEQVLAADRHHFEVKHRFANGSIRDVEVFSGPIEIDGQQRLLSIVHDISDRVQAQEQVQSNASRLESLFRIVQYDADNIQDLLDYALEEAIKLTGSTIGYIYHYDEAQQLFTLNTWSDSVMEECTILEPKSTYELEKTGIWGEAVRQRQPIVINDFLANNPLKKGYPEGHAPLVKFLTVPVFRGDRIVAVVGVANKPTDYTPTDVWQLSLLTDSVWKMVERKRVEESLRASEAYTRSVLDNLPIGVAVNSVEPVEFTYMNDNFPKFYRTTREELENLDSFWQAVYHDPAYREEVKRRVLDDIASGDPARMRWHDLHVSREGETTTYVSAMNAPILDTKSMLSMVWDTTDRKRAEESLRASEEKYRQIVETAQEGIWIIDDQHITTFVNQQMAQMLGYTIDEMMGQSVFNFMDDEAQKQAIANLEQHREGPHEFAYQRKDGSPLWTLISTNSLYDSKGRYVGSQAMVTDITNLKQIQQAEREQRVLADALVETATALISVLDLDSVMHTLLENVARVVPHDAANIMLIEGERTRPVYWRGYDPEYVSFLQGRLFAVSETPSFLYMIQTGVPYLASYTDQAPDWVSHPLSRWIKSHIAAPIRSHGMVIGFLNLDSQTPGHFTEVHTGRLRAFADQASITIEHAQLYEEIRHHAHELEQRVVERTAQLHHAKERIEAILNSSSDVMIICRADGRIDQVNPAFDTIFGGVENQGNGLALVDLVSQEHSATLQLAFEGVLESRRSRRVEVTVLCSGRAPFVADAVLSPIIGHDHMLLGVVCNLRDMTPHKLMESQLRQMLKQAMELTELKSRYVSMAAHDLRNPLAIIQSSLSLIEQYGDRLTPEKLKEKYERIQTSIMVMVDMLDDILTLGKAESDHLGFNPTPLDVVAFCHGLAAEITQVIGGPSRVEFVNEGECGLALLDGKLLRHILGNLLSNALKYSPAHSPVTFAAHCEPDQITFRVQDHGIGIPEADQKRLFEAFYRASNAKSGPIPGTGLGLAIVKQSVSSHGGTITFESREGSGTTFTVVLPQPNQKDAYEKNTGY